MKFLLVAVNAKYIHSNPGVYSLKMYADHIQKQRTEGERMGGRCPDGQGLFFAHENESEFVEESGTTPVCVEIAEYTINHSPEQVLEDIYQRKPDILGFSCYIWNICFVMDLIHDVHKIMSDTDIWTGGPEVSFDGPKLLRKEPEILGVMKGEGEEVFAGLLDCYRVLGDTVRGAWKERQGNIKENIPENEKERKEKFCRRIEQLPGITCRLCGKEIWDHRQSPPADLSRFPFLYEGMDGFENRIVYYESSRGCPFSCSYCLSSIDKTVRFRDLDLVKRELDFFLERKVPQVKFVDRTFNCRKSHAMEIWKYILEHDNGVTNFHFEIAADLMDESELELMSRMRKGLIQLEIGVQSTNPDTIREIHRKMDLEKVRRVVARIHAGRNVHQHLDLIAGLPFEDFQSFHRSFNQVYAMEPEQLQLGFLKVLKGSFMYQMADQYEIVYGEKPPYEVLSTKWLSYEDIRRLKGVEDMVEVYYNSGQFSNIMRMLTEEAGDAFELYGKLAEYYVEKGLNGRNHSRMARYDILYGYMKELTDRKGISSDPFTDALVCDCYLRENCKSRPAFALDQTPYKEQIRALTTKLRSLGTQVHVEVLRSGEIWLFDYRKKDVMTRNAIMSRLK